MKIRQTLAASAIVLGTLGVASANAGTITGGNPAINASVTDSYANFSILDSNNPISGNGELTSWSFYASNANPVELLIYGTNALGYTIVGQSALVTPNVGLNILPLNNLPVQQGDLVGLYFQGTGTVPFNYTGVPVNAGPAFLDIPDGFAMLYTNNDSGISADFVGSSDRIYSVNVTGTEVPEPLTLSLFGAGLAGAAALRRRKKKVA
jgi:hypothetical protein